MYPLRISTSPSLPPTGCYLLPPRHISREDCSCRVRSSFSCQKSPYQEGNQGQYFMLPHPHTHIPHTIILTYTHTHKNPYPTYSYSHTLTLCVWAPTRESRLGQEKEVVRRESGRKRKWRRKKTRMGKWIMIFTSLLQRSQ